MPVTLETVQEAIRQKNDATKKTPIPCKNQPALLLATLSPKKYFHKKTQ
jgi:hypothetical protein